METNGGELNDVWVKNDLLKFPENARMKSNAYESKLMHEVKIYMLLYKDNYQALFTLGQTNDFFEMSKYKKGLGHDYLRLSVPIHLGKF